jgi:hypothetical protein
MDEYKFIITTVVTVILAISGYFLKYYNDLRISKRKEKLERVNRQLKVLYGPLLSLTTSSDATWREFRKKHRKDTEEYFDEKNPPSDEEKEIWRNWIINVFYPNTEKIFNLIIENGDLIIEDDFPKTLRNLCSHFESYKTVIDKWKRNDFSEHVSLINYPDDIEKYALKGYQLLKNEQGKLIK